MRCNVIASILLVLRIPGSKESAMFVPLMRNLVVVLAAVAIVGYLSSAKAASLQEAGSALFTR